jgi:L-Ala-D/L-Glu epimerase
MKNPLRVAGREFITADLVVVTLTEGHLRGYGEAAGVYYKGETTETMEAQLETLRPDIENGLDRDGLRRQLPPGGARSATDCALWDLEAKRAGCPAWQLAGLPPPKPRLTTFTLGAESPGHMASAARDYSDARALKLKLTGESLDADRVRAVRAARPDVWLMVDGNQSFTRNGLENLLPVLQEARVELIEQPLPVGCEIEMMAIASAIPTVADESVQSLADVAHVACFDVVSIKLDKCGGFTEALLLVRELRRRGRRVMVGCMPGTSLAMAPAFALSQACDFVDLDAPLFLSADRDPPATYRNGEIWCPPAAWGSSK